MKITRLDLQAFGPFTDASLDLSAGNHGLHLVYGANEAGKSSALRAVHAWLFGIDRLTPDNFLHKYTKLRIGGELVAADGSRFSYIRRKANKDTVLAEDGKATLDDQPLRRMLGAVNGDVFSKQFGLSHASLASGGAELLAERGAEASALFGSGIGGTAVHKVLRQLQEEANTLFLRSGSKPQLNAKLAALRAARQELERITLSARAWQAAQAALADAQERRDRAASALRGTDQRMGLLNRVLRTAPVLARRADLQLQLQRLGPMPDLAEDAAERHAAAAEALRDAAQERNVRGNRVAGLRAGLEGLEPSDELLQAAPEVAALVERVGAVASARDDSANVASSVARDRKLLAAHCARWGWPDDPTEQIQQVQAVKQQVAEAAALAPERRDEVQRAGDALAQLQARQREQEDRLQAVPAPADTAALERSLARARGAVALDERVAELQAAVHRLDDSLVLGLQQLGRWQGDLDALQQTALPAVDLVRQRSDAVRDCGRAVADAEQTLVRLRGAQAKAEVVLDGFATGAPVPSLEQLKLARAARDSQWQDLCKAWQSGAAADAGRLVSFEQAMAAADSEADALRAAAERVQQLADAKLRCQVAAAEVAQGERALAHARTALEDAGQAALGLWQGLPVQVDDVQAMAAWLTRAEALRAQAGERAAQQAQLQRSLLERHQVARHLHGALADPAVPEPAEAEPLAPLVAAAEQQVLAARRAANARDKALQASATVARDCTAQQERLAQAEQRQAGWQGNWAELMQAVGLPADATPGAARDLLAAADEMAALHSKVAAGERRLTGMAQLQDTFAAEVAALVQRLAPDLADHQPTAALQAVQVRLSAAREAAARQQSLADQLALEQAALDKANAAQAAAEQDIAALVQLAGVADASALPLVFERQARHRALADRIREQEDTLGREPAPLAELEQEVVALAEDGGQPVDIANAELVALRSQREDELEPAHADAVAAVARAEDQVGTMRGDEAAALKQEEIQQLVAEVQELAAECARLRLARRVLSDTVERFRREHRDPILAAASGWFSRVTGGAFTSIDTVFADRDEPELVAVRANGDKLPMAGLSTGTRDQLWLALRLANLEHYMGHAEPLPLIVDDILVQFDDSRTAHTLAALADFSAHTQVVLFSHHQRVVEQAQALARPEAVFIHDLAALTAPVEVTD